jgi:hypothetical protein
MNSRRFLVFRMLVEFAIAIGLVIIAVRIRISGHIWLDVMGRVLLAILAIPIFGDAMSVRRDSLAF